MNEKKNYVKEQSTTAKKRQRTQSELQAELQPEFQQEPMLKWFWFEPNNHKNKHCGLCQPSESEAMGFCFECTSNWLCFFHLPFSTNMQSMTESQSNNSSKSSEINNVVIENIVEDPQDELPNDILEKELPSLWEETFQEKDLAFPWNDTIQEMTFSQNCIVQENELSFLLKDLIWD